MDIQVTKLELIEMLLKTEEIAVLEKIKAILNKDYSNDDPIGIDYDMIGERRFAHLNEESESYTWEDVKKKVRAAKL